MTAKVDAPPRGWTGLVFAIQFLTILPLRTPDRFDARAALPYFPICGLLIGALLTGIDAVAGFIWPRPVAAVLDVLLLAVISGALHLDGLADTADGLYGKRPLDRALAIMKDSRIGSMGVVAVVCCLAVKWAALANLSAPPVYWLVLVPAYARAAVLIGSKALPYGRAQEGTAHPFFETPLTLGDFWGLLVLVAASLSGGWRAMGINLGFTLLVMAVLVWYKRKTGCVTGDMLGALIEVTESGLFLLAAASRWW